MLERLFDLARTQLSNQFISGGLLLMFTGSVIAFARNLPNKIWGRIKDQFIVDVEIASSDPLFDWITLWLNDQPYSRRTRRLIATTVPSYEGGEGCQSVSSALRADDTPKPKLILSPARGQHFFLWGGRLLWLSRGNLGDNAPEGGANKGNSHRNSRWNLEAYSVRVFGRKQDVLRQLMDLVIDRAVKFQEKKISAFVGIYGDWRRLHTFTPRKLDSVILPSGVTEAIMADLQAFIAAKNWYIDLGIPYHHGYLFHGTPGSGKTSIIGALAGELRMNLYLLNLANEDLDDERFASMLSSIPPQSFMVLEDVDAALGTHIRREDRDGHKGLTLTGLLNSLDGFMAKDGSIVFMTTNHRELLDPALLRPGRVDMQIEFTEATREQKVRMFQRFYPTAEPDAAEIFADFPDIRTMAEAQQQLLEMRDNPEITTKEERKAMGARV